MFLLKAAQKLTGYEPLPSDLDNRAMWSAFAFCQNWATFIARGVSYWRSTDPDFMLCRFAMPPRSRSLEKPRVSRDVKIYEAEFGGVPVRIYEPLNLCNKRERSAMINYHGGGGYMASARLSDFLMVYLAKELQVIIISVDFRLAPENPFPVQVDDCVVATKYVFEHAQELGVNAENIILFGESYGGLLVASVLLKIRDEGLPYRPKLQVLIYPMMQGVTFTLPSYQRRFKLLLCQRSVSKSFLFKNEKFQGRKDIDAVTKKMALNQHISAATKARAEAMLDLLPEEFLNGYEPPEDHGTDETLREELEPFVLNPYVSPLFADNFAEMPEAYVWIAGYDVLRDEGMLYAKRLEQAGNKVTLVYNATAPHGSWSLSPTHGKKYRTETVDFIKRKLRHL